MEAQSWRQDGATTTLPKAVASPRHVSAPAVLERPDGDSLQREAVPGAAASPGKLETELPV